MTRAVDRVMLRTETADDAVFLAALFRDAWPLHDRLAALEPTLAARLIHLQIAAQARSYRAAFPRARFEIVTVAKGPIGRLVVDEGAEGWTLIDLCLHEAWRGRGIGAGLIGHVRDGAAAAGVPVRLRVGRANVAARRLYERFGFVVEPTDDHDVVVAMAWRPPSPHGTTFRVG